jgi:hypothetical protein
MKINRRKLLAGLALAPAVTLSGEPLPAGHVVREMGSYKSGWELISLHGEDVYLRIEDEPATLSRNIYGRWTTNYRQVKRTPEEISMGFAPIKIEYDEAEGGPYDRAMSDDTIWVGDTYAIGTKVSTQRAVGKRLEAAEFKVRLAMANTITQVRDGHETGGPHACLTAPGTAIMMI